MIDFYVLNINPTTKSVIEKLQFKSKKINIHPEDTFRDIKNKIWILHDIPPFRQFLFTSQGFTLQDVYVNDIIIPCDINDWFNKNDTDIVLSDIPINKHITENKENIKVDISKESTTIGSTKFLYLVDLNTIFTRARIEDLNILHESFKFDIIYYGFVIMFWSMTHSEFKYYIKGKHDELVSFSQDEIESVYIKQERIIEKILKRNDKIGPIIVLNQTINIDLGVRNINIRNILDWISTDNNVPAIIAYINDNMEGKLIIKKHTSCDDVVNKIINRKSMLKVTKNTQPNIAFVIRRPPNNFIIFNINENGIGSNVYIEYNEDEKVKIEDNYKIIGELTKTIIKKINKELHVLALPDGGSMNYFSTNSILNQQLHICTYWDKSISSKSFLTIKENFTGFNESNIMELKSDECSHNDYHNDNCFLVQFTKGMSNPEGYEVKFMLRTTDIKIEVLKISSIDEFKTIQRYIFPFLNEQKISKDNSLDLSKVTLKALHEKDPALYDIKRYSRKAKVYSVLCQSERQPILYTDEEHKQLSSDKKKKTTKYWNFTYSKPAYYECPNKKFPHLSFKVGKHPKNYCLPCCKKSENTRSELDDKCLKEHTVYEEANETNYILTYGKPIPPGRISKISDTMYLRLSEDSDSCSLCNYVLYGVDQDLPGLIDCGLIISLLQSLAINNSVEDVIHKLIRQVMSYGSSYTIIGDGAAQVFDSSEHLVDTIQSIFLYKNMDLTVLEDVNEWNKIFMYLVKDVYNVETIIWNEMSSNDITVNISTDFIIDDEIRNLIVVRNKNGYYPIYITDGQVRSGNQYPIFTSMMDSDNTSAIEIMNKFIIKLSKDIKTNKGINQLCILDTVFKSTDKWIVEMKLVDSRNLCYAIVAYRNSDHEYVYIPIYYTSAGKYLKDIKSSHDSRPDHSYKQSVLKDFITDFNRLSENNTVCNIMTIEAESLVQNHDDNPKYIGFQLDRLIYYHDPATEPIMNCSTCTSKKLLYSPILVDKAMKTFETNLTPKDHVSEIKKTEYRNRLYKLFVSEFLYYLRQEKNKIVRSKLHKMITNMNFNVAKDITAVFSEIDKMKSDDKPLSYNDRYQLKKMISDLKDPHKIKQNMSNTIFEFDQTVINILYNKSIDQIESEVTKIMKSIVVLVDISEINEIFELSNMYSPCQADENNVYKYCKNKKLRVEKSMFNDYVKILSSDIHNSTVLNVSNVFDTSEFIKHKGESIVIYKK